MRTVKSWNAGEVLGITVGLRKDGSVAVLFDDNQIIWYGAEKFLSAFKVEEV